MNDVLVSVSDMGLYRELKKEWQSTIYNNGFLDDYDVANYICSFIDNITHSASSLFSDPSFVVVYDGLSDSIDRLFRETTVRDTTLESYLSSSGFKVKRRGIVSGLHCIKLELYDGGKHRGDFFIDVVDASESRNVLRVVAI